MNPIDAKTSMIINCVLAAGGIIVGAGGTLTTLFGQGVSTDIVAACGLAIAILGALNIVLHGYSSPGSGPMAPPAPPPAAPAPPMTPPRAAAALLALAAGAILGLLAGSGAASAQVRLVKPTGNIGNDIKAATAPAAAGARATVESILSKPFKDLADFIGTDSEEALALSTAIPDLQDGHGQQCWIATRQFGEVVKQHPIPLTLKAQTDLEALRLLMMAANNLCANVHCTQVFSDLANGVRALAPINAIPLPSLDSLCSKVPQIAVVPTIALPITPTPGTP